MKQSHTDFGERDESGERIPKRANSEDERGERHTKVPKADSERGTKGESGEHEPKGTKASDQSGERKVRMEGGVGLGKADSIGNRVGSHLGKHDGRTGELNDGHKGERTIYHHQRVPHAQDRMK
jgi:hypothetical protein